MISTSVLQASVSCRFRHDDTLMKAHATDGAVADVYQEPVLGMLTQGS